MIRAAIPSIPKGQWEAAQTIGMGYSTTLQRVVLPQAARVAVPPLSNTLISLVKDTSLASTILVTELLRVAQLAAAPTFDFFALYGVAAVYYWVICLVLSSAQSRLETRLERYMPDPADVARRAQALAIQVLKGIRSFAALHGDCGARPSGRQTPCAPLNALDRPTPEIHHRDVAVDFGVPWKGPPRPGSGAERHVLQPQLFPHKTGGRTHRGPGGVRRGRARGRRAARGCGPGRAGEKDDQYPTGLGGSRRVGIAVRWPCNLI